MRRLIPLLALLGGLLWFSPAYAINCAVTNGACYWIGGTGTLDMATDSAHWSNASNGSTCSCEPIATNSLTFDGSSGGGTVTVNANFTATAITAGAFTGTLDFSVNNNTVTLTGVGFNGSGNGARTFKMGSSIWNFNTCTATTNTWQLGTVTNLVWTPGTFTINWNCNPNGSTSFLGGNQTIPTLNVCPVTQPCGIVIGTANTFTNLTVHSGGTVQFGAAVTITNAVTLTGTSAAPILLQGSVLGTAISVTLSATPGTWDWVGLRDMTFVTNTPSVSDCTSFGHNSNVSCTAPNVVAGAGGFIIGGGI